MDRVSRSQLSCPLYRLCVTLLSSNKLHFVILSSSNFPLNFPLLLGKVNTAQFYRQTLTKNRQRRLGRESREGEATPLLPAWKTSEVGPASTASSLQLREHVRTLFRCRPETPLCPLETTPGNYVGLGLIWCSSLISAPRPVNTAVSPAPGPRQLLVRCPAHLVRTEHCLPDIPGRREM